MTKETSPKDRKLRHAEYYGMTEIFDKIYSKSLKGDNFKNLMQIIISDNNIVLAYRNIKRNHGSVTRGEDGVTIKDIENLNRNEFVEIVRKRFAHYNPRKVRRVEIPKYNGKLRPLGIPSIWDRIAQQCILQVLEPICEAKFNNHSYGFRPNRSAEHAIADCMARMNQSHMEYVVDVDIKGFFDEVNHTKLMRQIWSMGIRDKQLLLIIRKMLRAPVVLPNGKLIYPTKGTPQGGILSPLLANINLNEFDWWIANQWEEKDAKELKHHFRKNGAWDKGNIYHKLRKSTTLKEIYLVRYADDFKIFCRNYNEAKKVFYATKMWLQERLKLPISEEKSKITNLSKEESEFLGFTMKLVTKGNKKVVNTHIGTKAQSMIKVKLKKQIKRIQKSPNSKDTFIYIGVYNSMVIGIHNYFKIATHCSVAMRKIARELRPSFEIRLREQGISKEGQYGKYEGYKPYLRSGQIRYIRGFPILPVGYIQHRHPMCKKRNINKYTEEGREAIHKKQQTAEEWKISWLCSNPVLSKRATIEFADNRISKFIAQKGRCAVTGEELILSEMHCHHIIPYHESKSDSYENLVIVTEEVHRVIHATQSETIEELLKYLKLNPKQKEKLNELRLKVGNEEIS